jgi:hypothetical protein
VGGGGGGGGGGGAAARSYAARVLFDSQQRYAAVRQPGRLAAAPLALAAAVRMGDKHRQAIVCNRANRIAGVLLCVAVVALLIYAEYWIFYVYLPSPRSSARGKPDA